MVEPALLASLYYAENLKGEPHNLKRETHMETRNPDEIMPKIGRKAIVEKIRGLGDALGQIESIS